MDEETTIVIETFEDAEDTAVEEETMDDLVVEISEDSGEYNAPEESIVEEDILPAEELAETAEEDYMDVF